MSVPPVDLDAALVLYDQHRYLDAYEQTRALWDRPELAGQLPAEHLVHAARLAGRLGGNKVRRWLLREAHRREPDNPLVRYFSLWTARRHANLLSGLREYEERPELNSGDPRWDASYLAEQAQVWATMRDFDRAHEFLRRARALGAEGEWVDCCEAWILLFQDRWDDALSVIEGVWERSPGMPAAAAALGKVLTKLGRLGEAVDRLLPAGRDGQSYEVLLVGLWYASALAERSEPDQRRRGAARVHELADRLEELTPLADRYTASAVATVRLDAAMLLDDRERMRKHAARVRSPFVRTIWRNMQDNPQGRLILLPFRTVYQKHKTCLPASIAAVVGGFGAEVNEDDLAGALTYDGTPSWRAVDWLEAHGFRTRQFLATPALCRTLLKAGLPFVFMIESTASGHALAAVGLDEAAGTMILHDPGMDRWGRALIDKLGDDEAPLGPEGLAIVPADRADLVALLDRIPAENSDAMTACNRARKLWETVGPAAAGEGIDELARRYPDSPFSRRLRALHLGLTGELYQAIRIQEELLAQFPDCLALRRELLDNLRRTRDTVRLRQTLEGIVRRGQLPGIREGQAWRHPPALYVTQYADLLGLSGEGCRQGEKLLLKSLRHEPTFAPTYHVLGDLYARREEHALAALPFRLAATIEDENDHFARGAADALRLAGREDEGLDYLRRRVDRLGHRLHGGGAWVTYIAALTDFGRPGRAIAATEEAQASAPPEAGFFAFATDFWTRMGRWQAARESLRRAKETGHKPLFLQAAVWFHHRAGRWEKALGFAEQWVAECPDDLEARHYYLQLLTRKIGLTEALDHVRRWAEDHRDNDDFQELYYHELRNRSEDGPAEALLRARVERNPLDSWAWLELAQMLLGKAEMRGPSQREDLMAEVDQTLARYDGLCPRSPTALALRARLREIHGEREQAVELLLAALEIDPSLGSCYRQVWADIELLPSPRQREIIAQLERHMLRNVGQLHFAREMALRIAQRFGVREAESAAASWARAAPDDPEIIEAQADLLVHYGQGRQDAARAAEMLEAAVERFPNHFDLRASLARAYGVLLRQDDEIRALREALDRDPLNSGARRALAMTMARAGQKDPALALLRKGIVLDPQDAEAHAALADLLWAQNDTGRALDALRGALREIPESIFLREQLVDRLQDVGAHAEAVRVAGEGVARFPDGAYCHYLLARARLRSPEHTDMPAVEAGLRKALELNFSLYQAAELLSEILVDRRQFAEARQIIQDQIPLMNDPSNAHAQLACIVREQGKTDEALRRISDVVRRWPACRFAWWQLLQWLEADEEWGVARAILAHVPAPILDHPQFASRRLVVLGKAGAARETLDAEWDTLLYNFPEEESVHLRRLDELLERNDLARAQPVLTGLEQFCPDSGHLLARKVQYFSRTGAPEAAAETALALWQTPGGDDDSWPEAITWEALKDTGLLASALGGLLELVLSGVRVRQETFDNLIQSIRLLDKPLGFLARLNPANWFRTPAHLTRLRQLLAALDRVGWDNGTYKAAVLEGLVREGDPKTAREFWKSHKDLCRRQTPLWAAVARLLLAEGEGSWRALRMWMADWRDHEGVEMRTLTYYSLALRGGGRAEPNFRELYATSRDALDRLPLDQTACYHACSLCEAALMMNRPHDFLDAVSRYEALIGLPAENSWLPSKYEFPPTVLRLLRAVLLAETPKKVLRLTYDLAASSANAWTRQFWLAQVQSRLTPRQFEEAVYILNH